MLADRAIHIGVFADDLGGRRDRATLEAVVLGAEAALEGEQIQIVVDGLLVLLGPQLHVDLVQRLLGVLEVVLRQRIEDAVVGIEYLGAVGVGQHLRRHEDALTTEGELVGVAVVLQVDLGQDVDAVGEKRHAHRVGVVLVHIVRDVQLVDDELGLTGAGLDSGSQALEVRDRVPLGRRQISTSAGGTLHDAVLDDVLIAEIVAILVLPGLQLMVLELDVLLALVRLRKCEDDLGDPGVLPGCGVDVLGHHIVQLDVSAQDAAIFGHFHVGQIRDIGHGATGSLALLVLVALHGEVRSIENAADELGRGLVLDGDGDALVQQQVADVLADLLRHAQTLAVAALILPGAVVDAVLVEALDVRPVPAVPHGDLVVEGAVNGVDALLLEILENVHFMAPSGSSSLSLTGR